MILTSPGREESGLSRRVSPTSEPARASSLLRRASRASQVSPRAGPGESSLSAAQSRPGRVDFKLSVPMALQALATRSQSWHWHGQLELNLSAANSCLRESSAAR